MIYIHDRASAARALARDLNPPAGAALHRELALLTAGEHDLTPWTDIGLIEPGDTEDTIAGEAGFSPLVDPLSGARFGEPGFERGFDWLSREGGVYRMVWTFGSTHSTVLLVPDTARVLPDLLTMCRSFPAAGN